MFGVKNIRVRVLRGPSSGIFRDIPRRSSFCRGNFALKCFVQRVYMSTSRRQTSEPLPNPFTVPKQLR